MHKLGFYLQISSDQDGLFKAVRNTRPPVILIHTDGLNRDLLELNRSDAGPNAFVIGRMFKDHQQQTQMLMDGDPAANGLTYAEEILSHDFGLATQTSRHNGQLLIDGWMTLNEAIPGPASSSAQSQQQIDELETKYKRYDDFQVAFHQRLQQEGLEAVAFNFAGGNFSEPEHYLKYFQGTLSAYQYLGFHEYGWPHLNPDHPDKPYGPIQSGAGDYRRCMNRIRELHGNQHRVIITELGLTKEYRDTFSFPRHEQDGSLGDLGWLCHTQTLDQAYYFSSIAWYNRMMMEDDYVLGACLFEVGHSARFRSHRHLGVDNEGRALTIIERIPTIEQTPQEAPAIQQPPVIELPPTMPDGNQTTFRDTVSRLVGRFMTPASMREIMSSSVSSSMQSFRRLRRAFAGSSQKQVHMVNGRFFQAGRPFPPFIGVNLPHLLYLNDHDIVDQAHEGDLSLEEYLDETLALGGRVVRTFVPHKGNKNRAFSNKEMAERLVHVLQELDRREMYLLPSLIDLYHNVGAYPKAMERFYTDFGGRDPRVRLGPEFFTDGYRSRAYQDYLQTIIQSVPSSLSHTILGWEIGNELKMENPGLNPPNTISGDPVQFVKFNRDMASMIKRFDPHRHMITTGLISTQHAYLKGRHELIAQLYGGSEIDFLTVHVYYGKNDHPAAQMTPNNEPDMDAVFARRFGKPIVVGEAGVHNQIVVEKASVQNHRDIFRKFLNADLERWLQGLHFQGEERQPATGYMIWRPPFGHMASGELFSDSEVLQELLNNFLSIFSGGER